MEKKNPRLARMHHGAGYTLHEDVRHPTPSLLRASQIGVLTHDESSMADRGNKDALLVVSYGAARQESRHAAIEPILDAIAEENPEADLYEAYTSRVMRQKIQAAGLEMPSVEEALETLLANGYTRAAVASLHLFPGTEYMAMIETFNAYRFRFKRLVLGTPLLYWMGQEEQRDDAADFVRVLRQEFSDPEKGEALLFMAHGTLHPSNCFYTLLQTRMDMARWDNAFVYTLAGWPRMEQIIPELKERGIRRVKLAPLMLAIGAHVTRDMGGDAPESHRSRLLAEGFEVEVLPKGLGELPAIREMYIERANEVWDKLREE
ncbi:MAG: sirohydrochlorin cobaltochelatase [Lachnospiraceae bacterium]|nr:sirohydrochlorin cobaltochelatase [Lachnospiraceae bacterium]